MAKERGFAREWIKFALRHGAFPAVIAVLLILYWRQRISTVFGYDIAAILCVVGGWKIFYEAISNLLRGRISADLAVAIAAVAALAVGEYLAAAEVILIMLIGEALEEFAVDRSRDATRRLASLQPPTARVRRDGEEREIPAEQVVPGDILVIRPGERIPVDGEVIGGTSAVDQSAVTGESMPVSKAAGDEVYAGTLNGVGVLEVRATATVAESALATIVRLVEEAEEKKAPIERRADRYATFFVPVVLAAALVTYLITRNVLQAIAVLIIACPCALILATPTGVAAAIGRLALDGILVKSGAALETSAGADCVVLDKTGTLTYGRPELAEIVPLAGLSADEVLRLAAIAEGNSEHALGALIREEARARGIVFAAPDGFEAVPGMGVRAQAEGQRILVGTRAFLERSGVPLGADVEQALRRMQRQRLTAVLVARGEQVVGVLGARDPIRPEARGLAQQLRQRGVRRVVVLTGDNESTARHVASELGLAEVAANLLPEEKVERIRALQQEGAKVVMVGDGINDAPSLAAADVGVAMGGTGTDIAAEASDVVLMTDDLSKLPYLIGLSRRAHRTILFNIIGFALIWNGLAVAAAAIGWIGPVAAAVVHQISSLAVVCNSLLLLAHGQAERTRVGRAWLRLRALPGDLRRRLAGVDWPAQGRKLWEHRRPIARWGALALVALWLFSGAYTVGPEEKAVTQLFGRLTQQITEPGLHYWPPYPIGKVTVIECQRVRRDEVGFRTRPGAQPVAVGAYEWGIQHRTGGYEKREEESILITGDANLVSVTLVAQYRVVNVAKYVFCAADPTALIHAATESAVREVVNCATLDAVLTQGREEIERDIAEALRRRLAIYDCGIEVVGVSLQDVHPPIEVVAAFRDVFSAREQKQQLIEKANAYKTETKLLTEGQAAAQVLQAEAYAIKRKEHAAGEARRFISQAKAYAKARRVTRTRLYIAALEQALATPKKLILDPRSVNGRQMLLLEKGALQLAGPPATELTPPPEEAVPEELLETEEYAEEFAPTPTPATPTPAQPTPTPTPQPAAPAWEE